MPDITVLISDDHPIVIKGIKDIVDSAIGMKVVGEAHTGELTLQLVDSLKPEVLLLDMELPDISGVEVVRRLMEKRASVRILALSSYDDREYISQMLALGASGYLIKDEVPETIVEAVRGIARGEKGWVSRKVAAKLSQILQDDKVGGKDLTNRELDVLRNVVDGKTNAEIGMLLGISEKTVEKHLDGIFKKLSVSSRVEAAVMAVRENYF